MKEETLTVKVTPKSSKTEIIGWENTILKVRLKAVPEKGEANDELIRLLSKHFKVPQSHITIIRGHKSRTKVVKIRHLA